MPTARTAAVVGAAGGVGATRTCVEAGALLAAAGEDVLVFDVAHATQGLSTYVDARLDPDATALLTDPGVAVTDAAYPLDAPGDGTLALAPVHAPLSRSAEALTPDAGERVGDRLDEAVERYDYVLVDTPPILTNPAIGAVTAADVVAAVTTADDRGADALARERGRFADLGTGADVVAANRASADGLPDADVVIPETALGPESEAPAVAPASPDDYTRAVASLLGHCFDLDELVDDAAPGFLGGVRRRLS